MCIHTVTRLCCACLFCQAPRHGHRVPDLKRTRAADAGPAGERGICRELIRPVGLLSHPSLAQRREGVPGARSRRVGVLFCGGVRNTAVQWQDGLCSGRSSRAGAASGLDGRLTSTGSQWRRLCASHGYAEARAALPLVPHLGCRRTAEP